VRFTVALPTDRVDAVDEFVSGEAVAEVAATVERVGLDAVFVTDHPAPDSRWLDGGGHHALEPTVALGVAAAATSTVRLHTHIYVLAYRNPFLAAKALGTLEVLSGGRGIYGIGPGYLRPEFDALGMDFDSRVEATDRAVDLMRRLWHGETVAAEGDGFRARAVFQRPAPAEQPTLWFGGNSRRSMERAVALGQGWSPFPTPVGLAAPTRTASIADLDELAQRMAMLDRCVQAAERHEPLDVCFSAFSMPRYASGEIPAPQLVDELGAMAELGVTWTAVGLWGRTRSELVERIEQFGHEVARHC
jgi:probable F420-dependent oxidoreductase